MNVKSPVLVGVLMSSAIVSLTYMVMSTSKDKYDDDSTYVVYADFDDASGIRSKTRVQINGIDVGRIGTIKHVTNDKGQLTARVAIHILDDYEIHEDATVKKAAESLLGDYRIDIFPGTIAYRKLQEGEVIGHVISKSEMDAIQSELVVVANNIKDITGSLKGMIDDTEGSGSLKAILERVERAVTAIEASSHAVNTTITMNQKALEDIISNVNQFSSNLADSSVHFKDDFEHIVGNAKELSERLNGIAESVSGVVGPTEGELREGVNSLRETLDTLNDTLKHMEDIAAKVNNGEGTAGKIINDPAIANAAEDVIESASTLMSGFSSLRTEVELRTEYVAPLDKNLQDRFVESGFRSTVGVKIIPRPDKYYLLELVDDPRGSWERKLTLNSDYTLQGQTWVETNQRMLETNEINYDSLKISAQLAKRFYFLTLRLGIIESTGGLGMNIHMFDDQFELKVDFFDFSFRDQYGDPINENFYARIRAMALYEIYPHLIISGGIDDPLNDQWFSYFVGAGLRFTDEDLKSLLMVAPTP